MDKNTIITELSKLFQLWSDETDFEIHQLPVSGSERIYYRFICDNKSALGVYNSNHSENISFLSFWKSFQQSGLKVPYVYLEKLDSNIYLIEDLGEENLLQYLEKERTIHNDIFPDSVFIQYKKALKDLIKIQIEVDQFIDYELSYPSKIFDFKSMHADCNLFKYWFLYPTKTIFNETALENDFELLCNFLSKDNLNYFMFRDFQARNIMVKNNELFYIDFQGGRKGPLQYDLASLLFQAKANIPADTKEKLLDYYIDELNNYVKIDKKLFRSQYYGFVLLRSLQVLGAYGFKGYFQKKDHFLSSIPYAIQNLNWWMNHVKLPIILPELNKVIHSIIDRERLFPKKEIYSKNENIKPLHLHIRSFAYKNGLPEDESKGFGQGFVFDCRFIHNPGRYEPFMKLSGLDKEVQEFLERDGEIQNFLNPVFTILDQAVEKYLNREFEYLGINFGCTGGQHRSVYSAEKTLEYLKMKYSDFPVKFTIQHREKDNWNK